MNRLLDNPIVLSLAPDIPSGERDLVCNMVGMLRGEPWDFRILHDFLEGIIDHTGRNITILQLYETSFRGYINIFMADEELQELIMPVLCPAGWRCVSLRKD